MAETWLKTNTRLVWLGMIPPALALLIAAALWAVGGLFARVAAAILLAAALAGLLWLVRQLLRPRLAYDQGRLLVYLGPREPQRVPIDIVEGFLLGQRPATLPGPGGKIETSTLVIRLAERELRWSYKEVPPSLGSWCNHYVSISGMWCEPLDVALVNRLNQRLAEAQGKLDRRAG